MSSKESLKRNPKWFSTAVANATNNSPNLNCNPFPQHVRDAIETHIDKARHRRKEALDRIRKGGGGGGAAAAAAADDDDDNKEEEREDTEKEEDTCGGYVRYEEILSFFQSSAMSKNGSLDFDGTYYPLYKSLLQAFQLPNTFDLSQLHENTHAKMNAFYSLTTQQCLRKSFQNTYDQFVREICVPHLISLCASSKKESSWNNSKEEEEEEVYYQAFPCIRIVQPHDFSIGPHADVMYGHHPCSINYYLPLTYIGGTSALFLESEPYKEDWQPIVGHYGFMKHFAGGMNMHFTVENQTEQTRVSLDFRLVIGSMFNHMHCHESQFLKKDGYYSKCRKNYDVGVSRWVRIGDLLEPDARMGFPWTVKDWDKIRKQI